MVPSGPPMQPVKCDGPRLMVKIPAYSINTLTMKLSLSRRAYIMAIIDAHHWFRTLTPHRRRQLIRRYEQ